MPLKIKFQILLAVLIGVACLFLLWSWHWTAGLAFLIAVALYVEMIFPPLNFFSHAVTKAKPGTLALTFDDGPSEWTPKILDALKDSGVKATFFLLGRHVDQFPEVAKRIADEGHSIGVHGYSHTKLHLQGPRFIRQDLEACIRSFERAGIKHDGLIRFPHGFKNFWAVGIARDLGLTVCSWTRGVWDSKNPGVDHIVSNAKDLKSGDILLLHDGDGNGNRPREQTALSVPLILKHYSNKTWSLLH